jgi:integrase
VRFRCRKRLYKRSLRVTDRELAHEIAERLWNEVQAERRFGVRAVTARTIGELFPLYRKTLEARDRSLAHIRQSMSYLERTLEKGARPVEVRTEDLLRTLENGRWQGRTRAYVGEVWRAFFRWCRSIGELERVPTEGVPIVKTARTWVRRRAMTVEEVRRLMAAAPKERALYYLIILRTGLRPAEVRSLTWADLDLEKRTITVRAHASKTQDEVTLPLADDLREALVLEKKRASVLLDAARVMGGKPVRAVQFYQDLLAAKVPLVTAEGRLDIYALRVTFITWLGESGATLLETQKLARHSSPHLTSNVYTRFKVEGLREKVRELPGSFTVGRRKKNRIRRGRRAS